MPTSRYRVDESDIITWVSGEWLEFARANAAGHLTVETVVGRSLWDFVTGDEIRRLYHLLFARVRTAGIPVSVPFRCDSPEARRFMQLHVTPGDVGSLELTAHLVSEERREHVPLLDAAVPRTSEFVTVCTWCRRVLLAFDEWVEPEIAMNRLGLLAQSLPPQITHGACPACYYHLFNPSPHDAL